MAWKLRKDKLKSDESESRSPDVSPAASDQAPAETQPAAFEHVGPPLGVDLSANISSGGGPAFTSESAEEPQFAEDALPKFADSDVELPRFLDDSPKFQSLPESPESLAAPVEDEPVFSDDIPEKKPITLGQPEEQEPISLGAFTPYQPPPSSDTVANLEPLPEFDPTVAPSAPDLEPEAVTMAPLVFADDLENTEPAAAGYETDAPVTLPAAEPVALPVEAAATPAEEPLTFADEEDDSPTVAPFDVSPEREAAAPGLVTTESDTGLPRVAPFILDTPEVTVPTESDRMHHVVLRLGNLSASYILVKDVTTIGRPDSAVQNYPDIEVELDDGVSRRHAEIRKQQDQFYVVDMGSTNGTILNGEMLSPEQPVPLHTGDRIRIGERTEMLFE